MARDDSNYTSDLDLLLITCEELEESRIEKMIPKHLLPRDRQLSIAVYSEQEFFSAYNKGSLFIAHILKDGKLVYDNGFFKKLCKKTFVLSKNKLKFNLRLLEQRLSVAEDMQKFNHIFIALLSDFFSISRNLAYTLLAIDGEIEFSRNKAFSMLMLKYPKCAKEIELLQSLEPFFLLNAKGISEPMPFNPTGCDEKIIEIKEDISKLIRLGVEKTGD